MGPHMLCEQAEGDPTSLGTETTVCEAHYLAPLSTQVVGNASATGDPVG